MICTSTGCDVSASARTTIAYSRSLRLAAIQRPLNVDLRGIAIASIETRMRQGAREQGSKGARRQRVSSSASLQGSELLRCQARKGHSFTETHRVRGCEIFSCKWLILLRLAGFTVSQVGFWRRERRGCECECECGGWGEGGVRAGNKGASHPSEQMPLAGGPGREQEARGLGLRELECCSCKKYAPGGGNDLQKEGRGKRVWFHRFRRGAWGFGVDDGGQPIANSQWPVAWGLVASVAGVLGQFGTGRCRRQWFPGLKGEIRGTPCHGEFAF